MPATLADANADAPDKEPRRFILIEMEPKIAREVTAERVRRVAEGYTNAKGQPVALVVDPSQSVDFRAMTYEPSWLYEGGFQFRKHYFGPKPGELRERAPQSGAAAEEFLCAQHIDGLPEVRFWVRNLSRKESSFRLQTSTDWFYPDFVCKLVDDRILAVEYKGSNLYDTTDAEEKRAVGAVWAARSGNRCLFVMPTGRDFSAIDVAVESTNFDERSSDKSLVHGSTARHAHGSPRTDNHE